MVTRLDDLALMAERRFPPGHALHRVHVARGGHDVGPGNHPVVDLCESQDVGEVVVVTAAALVLVAGEGVRRHHAHWACRRGAEEPAAARGLDPGIDPLHVGGPFVPGREDLDLREADVFARAVGRFEAHPFHLSGSERHTPGASVVGNPRYADFRTVAEAERASGQMLFGRYAVIEHHALDGHLLVPFQLRPRHVHHAP